MSQNDPIQNLPLYRRLRDARRAKALTQSELARQAGCQQSAISMLERGKMDALAHSTVAKIAEILGVEIAAEAKDAPVVPAVRAGRPLCPNEECPSNVPYHVNGEILFWPRPQPTPADRHCAYCGEVLERSCNSCQAPVMPGACCTVCGKPYIMAVAALEGDPAEWALRRQREIREWRALL